MHLSGIDLPTWTQETVTVEKKEIITDDATGSSDSLCNRKQGQMQQEVVTIDVTENMGIWCNRKQGLFVQYEVITVWCNRKQRQLLQQETGTAYKTRNYDDWFNRKIAVTVLVLKTVTVLVY